MKVNKLFVVTIVGIGIGIVIGHSPGMRRMLDSPKERQASERERRWAEEDCIKKQFDVDFSFVCDRIAQRDIEIYALAEKRDREILAKIERLTLPTNSANKYRVQLETNLKFWLNHHIQDCIRIRSRIQEGRGLLRTSAHRCRADIYQTKCDCDCCEKY